MLPSSHDFGVESPIRHQKSVGCRARRRGWRRASAQGDAGEAWQGGHRPEVGQLRAPADVQRSEAGELADAAEAGEAVELGQVELLASREGAQGGKLLDAWGAGEGQPRQVGQRANGAEISGLRGLGEAETRQLGQAVERREVRDVGQVLQVARKRGHSTLLFTLP